MFEGVVLILYGVMSVDQVYDIDQLFTEVDFETFPRWVNPLSDTCHGIWVIVGCRGSYVEGHMLRSTFECRG